MDIPSVTPADLAAFHSKHFTQSASLSHDFPQSVVEVTSTTTVTGRHDVSSSSSLSSKLPTRTAEAEDVSDYVLDNGNDNDERNIGDDDDDDGLGYYPDGVKRTLTDEQILMFRHSEEEAIRREERHRLEALKQKKEDEEQEALAAEEDAEEAVAAAVRRIAPVKEIGDDLFGEQQQQISDVTQTSNSESKEHNHPLDTTKDAAAAAAATVSRDLHTGGTDIRSERDRQGIARTDKNSGRTFLWPSITKS